MLQPKFVLFKWMLLYLFPSLYLGIMKKPDKEATGEKHIANEISVPPEPLLPVKEVRLYSHITWLHFCKSVVYQNI